MKYRQLCPPTEDIYLSCSGGCKSQIQVLADLVPGRVLLLAFRRPPSCRVHTWRTKGAKPGLSPSPDKGANPITGALLS